MTPQPEQKKGMSTVVIVLIVIAVGFGACSCIGILAAIAIPNFVKFESRSKQSECKVQLKAAFTAEKSYFAEKNRYTENPEELGWSPDGPRSVVLFSQSAAPVGRGPNPDALAEAIRSHTSAPPGLGITGTCPQCEITIGCALNVDNDPEIDVWSISTAKRNVGSGEPYNDFNDVTDSPGR